MADTGDLPVGAAVLWTIRPDHVTVLPAPVGAAPVGAAPVGFPAPAPAPHGDGRLYPALVDDVADIGTLTIVTVRLSVGLAPGPELRIRTTAPVGELVPGDPCLVRLDPADITAWVVPDTTADPTAA